MNKKFSLTLSRLAWLVGLVSGQSAVAATLPAAVPNAIISAVSSWGTAADAWAGYTGALGIWVPSEVHGGWTLTFQSAGLGKQVQASSFWNAKASYDTASAIFTITSHTWNGDVPPNSVLDIGFNASGVLTPSLDLTNCQFNGQPCVVSVMSHDAAQLTLANLKAGYQGGGNTPPPSDPPPVTGGTPTLQALFSITSSWDGGYSGNVAIKNLSSSTLAAGASGWRAVLKLPDESTARDVFKSGPWNMAVGIGSDGTATLKPMAWSAALAAGDIVQSGFNGGSRANLQKVASGDPSVTVVFGASVPTPVDPVPPPIEPPPPNNGQPPPTGGPDGFVFSPYKDVTISMNWNNNVISTAVSGTLSPLLGVMPTKLPAVTWAFATGECGNENWAGIQPSALVQANLQSFVDANVDYIISTGGAAGAFTCSTENGMRAFINRYASSNLVGIDFDIEAGQSQAAIASLVKQVAAVQADYPNLRFSFTVATLGSSNGAVTSSPYGDLNVTGHNVLQAIHQQGLADYTINLMVMDYGNAVSGNCVVVNGVCDMGKTAIQAARNLNAKYGVPFNRIELTPMIGMNDVTDEIFSLQDTDVMIQWAIANQLAGVHFWSLDRDKPCTLSNASPICSSLPNVSAWGFTNRFISALGL